MTGWQRHGQRRADALRGGAAGTDFVRSLVDADGTVGVLIVTELHIHQFGRRDRQIGRVLCLRRMLAEMMKSCTSASSREGRKAEGASLRFVFGFEAGKLGAFVPVGGFLRPFWRVLALLAFGPVRRSPRPGPRRGERLDRLDAKTPTGSHLGRKP